MIKAVYIHIPFCTNICTYCDFCKVYKYDKWIDKYLLYLKQEIKTRYKNETINTLYIGGGSPSCLSIDQLKKLFEILSTIKLSKNPEITFEANLEDLDKEKIKYLKNKINRISIGIQTFNNKYLKVLGRSKIDIEKIKYIKKHFKNINIDLMYNFKNQTKKQLQEDIEKILKLDIPHISTYSLILEKNTILYNQKYSTKNTDYLDKFISSYLKEKSYIHYEISNFAKENYQSKHNLVYWNNEQYYGFGLGASGYIKDIRYENTKSLTNYLKGKYIHNKHKLDINEKLQNEFILGFRKIKGINKKQFLKKYQINIKQIDIVDKLLKQKYLLENSTNIYINPKYIYISNEILINFIDIYTNKSMC